MKEFGKWLGRANGEVMVADCLKDDCTAEQMKAVVTTYCIIFDVTPGSAAWNELLHMIYENYNSWFDSFDDLKEFCAA